MSDFKLIAIRPLNKCAKRFLKVLEKDIFFYFDNDYKIEGNKLTYTPTQPRNIFYLRNGKPVNISAVVGKNGSGKSSIVELFYVIIHNLSCRAKLLINSTDKKPYPPVQKIYAELVYKIGNDFFLLRMEFNSIQLFIQKGTEGEFSTYLKHKSIRPKDIESLFYSIVINYSQYSLNEHSIGSWIKNIFDKNDGYQAPIVLSPYREDGNININNEQYLTFSRLLSNILKQPDSEDKDYKRLRELTPGKIVSEIKFTLNKEKARFLEYESEFHTVLEKNKIFILDFVFDTFKLENKYGKKYDVKDGFISTSFLYILKKLYHISIRYKPYQKPEYQFIEKKTTKFKDSEDTRISHVFHTDRLQKLVVDLKDDPSHISFKFKQAINFLHNFQYFKSKKLSSYNSVDVLAKDLNEIAKNTNKQIIEIIPPSFFDIDIKFTNGSDFVELSSGEKQKIFTSSAYLYHLINLNSVVRKDDVNKYNYINIIFDEIELYFHPEFQRNFVNDFLENLDKIELPDILGINCIFITHSPFILSDIPSQNILRLREGHPEKYDPIEKTFGANIHDLLANEFFMENGFMGEFARSKINATIDLLNYLRLGNELQEIKTKDTQLYKIKNAEYKRLKIALKPSNLDHHKNLINVIGEPILQKKLAQMFDSTTKENTELALVRSKISELRNLEKQLKSKKK